jgi:hypothetical protein
MHLFGGMMTMKKVAKIFRGAAYTLFRLELIIAFLCEIILIDLCEHPSAWQLISQDTILYSIMQVASVCLVVVETIIIAKERTITRFVMSLVIMGISFSPIKEVLLLKSIGGLAYCFAISMVCFMASKWLESSADRS